DGVFRKILHRQGLAPRPRGAPGRCFEFYGANPFGALREPAQDCHSRVGLVATRPTSLPLPRSRDESNPMGFWANLGVWGVGCPWRRAHPRPGRIEAVWTGHRGHPAVTNRSQWYSGQSSGAWSRPSAIPVLGRDAACTTVLGNARRASDDNP